MPQVTGDRFSIYNMADCEFCPVDRRKFRTGRVCGVCSRPLCVVCRPFVPNQDYVCPDCGGGPVEDPLHAPDASIHLREAAGIPVPYWLSVLRDRAVKKHENPDETLVPE